MGKSVFIHTFGCSLNKADSESVAGLLHRKGFSISANAKDADIIVVNTCTVKNLAESKLFQFLRENEGKKIVVSGCVPKAQPEYLKTKLKNYSVAGVDPKVVASVVERSVSGEVVQDISGARVAPHAHAHEEHEAVGENNQEMRELNSAEAMYSRLSLPFIRSSPHTEIIPISAGCLDACTYCKTKHARGVLASYRPREIRERVKKAVWEGVKEIYLTSQDNGCYGFDIGTNAAELLGGIAKVIPKDSKVMVRFGMSNPQHIKKILPELLNAFENNCVYKFLHIPLQSGSNRVLKGMKRNYKAEDYLEIVGAFRKKFPDITIATDIICGFPAETEEDFKETLKVLKASRPIIVNRSRFWPRPNTPAAKMKQLDSKIMMKRSHELKKCADLIAKQEYSKYIGKKFAAFINEKGKDGSMKGRTDNYFQIVTKKKCSVGDEIFFTAKKATATDLRDF